MSRIFLSLISVIFLIFLFSTGVYAQSAPKDDLGVSTRGLDDQSLYTKKVLNATTPKMLDEYCETNPASNVKIPIGVEADYLAKLLKQDPAKALDPTFLKAYICSQLGNGASFCNQTLKIGQDDKTSVLACKSYLTQRSRIPIIHSPNKQSDKLGQGSPEQVGNPTLDKMSGELGTNGGFHRKTTPIFDKLNTDPANNLETAGEGYQGEDRTTDIAASKCINFQGSYPSFGGKEGKYALQPEGFQECPEILTGKVNSSNPVSAPGGSNSGDACGTAEEYFIGTFDFPEADSSKLQKLNLNATAYWSLLLPEVASGGVPILSPSGTKGPSISAHDWCTASMEGSFRVKKLDGTIETYSYADHGGPAQTSTCWNGAVTNTHFDKVNVPFGRGAFAPSVIPYRTIAVDKSEIPFGTVIYIPEARGVTVTDSSGNKITHDGYFYAGDVGGKINNNHIDVFIGGTDQSAMGQVTGTYPNGSFDAYVVKDQNIIDYLKNLHNTTSDNCAVSDSPIDSPAETTTKLTEPVKEPTPEIPTPVTPPAPPESSSNDNTIDAYLLLGPDDASLNTPEMLEKTRNLIQTAQSTYKNQTGKTFKIGSVTPVLTSENIDYLGWDTGRVKNNLQKIVFGDKGLPENQVSLFIVNSKLTLRDAPVAGFANGYFDGKVALRQTPDGSGNQTDQGYAVIGKKTLDAIPQCDAPESAGCLFVTTAHELGHTFGLPHIQDLTNLMYPNMDRTDQTLNQNQINFLKDSLFFKN